MDYKDVLEEAVSADEMRKDDNLFENVEQEELRDTIGELTENKKKGFFGHVFSKAKGAGKLISRGSLSDTDKSLF